MISRPRTLCLTGAALMAMVPLLAGSVFFYVWLAPKTYTASTKLMVRPKSSQATLSKLNELLRDMSRRDRNLTILINPGNASLLELKTRASTPTAAVELANQRTQELGEAVRSRADADFSIIVQAAPNLRPVPPVSRATLTTLAVVALNVGLVGIICLVIGLLKSRRPLARETSPPPTT